MRSWFLRGLGVVYLCAFASLLAQAEALFGEQGILPTALVLARAGDEYGAFPYLAMPTLCWLGLSVWTLCAAGVVLSLALIAGAAPLPVVALLWALYLSVVRVGGVFLGYQWDALLVETGFLALLLAPRGWWLHRVTDEPSPRAMFLARWLLFRLMFFSGVVKLVSGDPAWRDLTALEYHWWTQPLPAWPAWLAARVPHVAQLALCWQMFAIELLAPLLVLTPWRAMRLLAFAWLVLLQVAIAATGSYAFFNLLALVLCIPLLAETRPVKNTPGVSFTRVLHGAGYAVILYSSIGITLFRFGLPQMPGLAVLDSFGVSSSYGLFAVMTKERREIVIEGSADGVEWKPYVLPFQPGPVDRRPRWAAPHQPRVDWQMWFAALGECRGNPWLLTTQRRLLEGNDSVEALFDENPFAEAPPRVVRTTVFQYDFAPPASDDWWEREEVGPYCPALTLDSSGNLSAWAPTRSPG